MSPLGGGRAPVTLLDEPAAARAALSCRAVLASEPGRRPEAPVERPAPGRSAGGRRSWREPLRGALLELPPDGVVAKLPTGDPGVQLAACPVPGELTVFTP